MKIGNMYRIKGLASLKRNDCLIINPNYAGRRELPIMHTGELQFMGAHMGSAYTDGDMVVCIGKEERRTGHYMPQPFYKILTLDGKQAVVSKSTRNSYFVGV